MVQAMMVGGEVGMMDDYTHVWIDCAGNLNLLMSVKLAGGVEEEEVMFRDAF